MPEQNAPLVLVVADDHAGKNNIANALRDAGFSVADVETGADALRLASNEASAIIVGAQLSDMEAVEVCRRLKTNPATASVPILQIASSKSDKSRRRVAKENSADAYLTESAEPRSVLTTVQALVRLRRAEERVQAAARAWQATFDAISDAIFLLDRNGRFLRCNASFAALVGKPTRELVDHLADELERALPAAAMPFMECLAMRRRASAILPVGDRWFRLRADPIFGDDGDVAGAVGILSDITENRCAEEARRASDEQFRDLVESVRDYAIFRTDPYGRATTWNEGVRRVLGFSESEFIGTDSRQLFSPEDIAADVPARELRQAAEQGSAATTDG